MAVSEEKVKFIQTKKGSIQKFKSNGKMIILRPVKEEADILLNLPEGSICKDTYKGVFHAVSRALEKFQFGTSNQNFISTTKLRKFSRKVKAVKAKSSSMSIDPRYVWTLTYKPLQ